MDYSTLRDDILDSRPDIDIKAVDKAYEFAKAAHDGQERYSGEPYIMHPVAAAGVLLRLNPDLPTIQACLLHDVTEDTEVTLDEIKKEFGDDVASLVEGMEKLAIVKVRADQTNAEKWKNMFLAMTKDIRIIFIKLADRLHNMQTLDHVPEDKRYRIAKESMDVHAAIASRLGIYSIKGELEDLCFKYLYPDEYEDLSKKLEERRSRSAECMLYATSQIEQLLTREGVKVSSVNGRMKQLWSLRQKMIRYDTEDLNEIYDVFAVRVILPDDSDLYSVLGLLHSEYIPLQDRFKDYVAVPKPNGYRSLHTTLVGLGGDVYEGPTEVQIRTQQMHRESEIGIASHWTYKAGSKVNYKIARERYFKLQNALSNVNALIEKNPELGGVVREWVEKYQHLHPEDRSKVEGSLRENGISDEDLDAIKKGRSGQRLTLQPDVDKQLAWLRGLAEEEEGNSEIDLYPDRIFVLTPQRDVVELQKGATPIDFAYAIHTEVGNKMVHARVNGRIVPLDYELKNGEVVEVGTRKNAKPSRYWLSIVKTASAKTKIKNFFNKEDKDVNTNAGRDLVNQQLAAIDQPLLDEKFTLLKDYGGKKRTLSEREQLLESVGLGTMTAAQVIKVLFPSDIEFGGDKLSGDKLGAKQLAALTFSNKQLTDKVLVTGEDDLPVVLSACCKPSPPAPIIGYVTRGRNIRIHRQSCRELAGLEGDRFVSAHWKKS